jgi:hypothetical protein
MYCPETIRINNKLISVTHYAKHDYITWDKVPFVQKINPLRYELIMRRPKHLFRINNKGESSRYVSNFLYAHVRPKLCKWLSIHQRYDFHGGEKMCHHCKAGEQP